MKVNERMKSGGGGEKQGEVSDFKEWNTKQNAVVL
jgi:hypothetical protein